MKIKCLALGCNCHKWIWTSDPTVVSPVVLSTKPWQLDLLKSPGAKQEILMLVLSDILKHVYYTHLSDINLYFGNNLNPWTSLFISIRDQFCSLGGGGGGGSEVSWLNIYSSACPKIKWFCPSITCFCLKMATWKIIGGLQPTSTPPPLPRKFYTCMLHLVALCVHVHVTFTMIVHWWC